MTCSTCGREVADTANFCRHCGSALSADKVAETPEIAETPPSDSEAGAVPEQLRTAIVSLQTQVAHLTSRVAALEGASSSQPQVDTNASPEGAGPAPRLPVPPSPAAAVPATAGNTPPAGPPTAAPAGGGPPRESLTTASSWNWEWLVGGNWLARIGILALIIGIGFFLKLAFDNQWIGETGRVVLGLAAGLGPSGRR